MYRLSLKAAAAVVAVVLCASSVNAGTYYVYYQLKSTNKANGKPTWIFGASFATEMDYRDLSTGKKTSAYKDALEFAEILRKDYGDDIADIEIRYKASPSSPTPPGDSRILAGMKPGGPNDFKNIGDGILKGAQERQKILDDQLRMKTVKDDLDKEKADLDKERSQLIQDGRDVTAQEQQIKSLRARRVDAGPPYEVWTWTTATPDTNQLYPLDKKFDTLAEAQDAARSNSRNLDPPLANFRPAVVKDRSGYDVTNSANLLSPDEAKRLEDRQRDLDRKRQDRSARVQKYKDVKKRYDAKAARYEGDDWWKAVEQYGRNMEAVNDSLKNLKLSQ